MTSFSKHAFGAVLALSVVACGQEGSAFESEIGSEVAAQISASSTVDVPVTLRGTAKATLKATVYKNPTGGGRATVLSVPGFTATAKSLEKLTAATFANATTGLTVKQVITVDLPGHAGSTKPTGIKYGELTVEDNATAIVQTIEALAAQGNGPQVLFGYGASGLAIATAQEQLLKAGSSLAKLGVTSALLYVPVPSAGRPWTQTAASATLGQYITTTDADGAVYKITDALWNRSGFTNKAGTGGVGAPTAEEVAANGYNTIEPAALVSQLTGVNDPTKGAPVPRPEVRAGAFAAANGTNLIVVGFSEGIQVTSADAADFYVHLTGDASKARFTEVVDPLAVSSAFITIPDKAIAATTKFFAPPTP
jgi:pimeloyl-ACP methyl ester carboxylesterase